MDAAGRRGCVVPSGQSNEVKFVVNVVVNEVRDLCIDQDVALSVGDEHGHRDGRALLDQAARCGPGQVVDPALDVALHRGTDVQFSEPEE